MQAFMLYFYMFLAVILLCSFKLSDAKNKQDKEITVL